MVLATTPNLASSELIRRCSTATIDNDRMALMLCLRTDFNEVFLCLQCYIAGATHDEESRCGAVGPPKSGLIRSETTL